MLTWAMAWMMVRLGEATGYLLVLSVIGDAFLALVFASFVNVVIKGKLAAKVTQHILEDIVNDNGTSADTA